MERKLLNSAHIFILILSYYDTFENVKKLLNSLSHKFRDFLKKNKKHIEYFCSKEPNQLPIIIPSWKYTIIFQNMRNVHKLIISDVKFLQSFTTYYKDVFQIELIQFKQSFRLQNTQSSDAWDLRNRNLIYQVVQKTSHIIFENTFAECVNLLYDIEYFQNLKQLRITITNEKELSSLKILSELNSLSKLVLKIDGLEIFEKLNANSWKKLETRNLDYLQVSCKFPRFTLPIQIEDFFVNKLPYKTLKYLEITDVNNELFSAHSAWISLQRLEVLKCSGNYFSFEIVKFLPRIYELQITCSGEVAFQAQDNSLAKIARLKLECASMDDQSSEIFLKSLKNVKCLYVLHHVQQRLWELFLTRQANKLEKLIYLNRQNTIQFYQYLNKCQILRYLSLQPLIDQFQSMTNLNFENNLSIEHLELDFEKLDIHHTETFQQQTQFIFKFIDSLKNLTKLTIYNFHSVEETQFFQKLAGIKTNLSIEINFPQMDFTYNSICEALSQSHCRAFTRMKLFSQFHDLDLFTVALASNSSLTSIELGLLQIAGGQEGCLINFFTAVSNHPRLKIVKVTHDLSLEYILFYQLENIVFNYCRKLSQLYLQSEKGENQFKEIDEDFIQAKLAKVTQKIIKQLPNLLLVVF